MLTTDVQELFDTEGNLVGVFLPAPVWKQLAEATGLLGQKKTPEQPEPLDDWDLLCRYWDFRYPVNTSVTCDKCGNSTPDWRKDAPRKFILLAASLGGLASWRCLSCSGRITKYHFKDKISCSYEPCCEKK